LYIAMNKQIKVLHFLAENESQLFWKSGVT
jgi:hypothetical protein